jgi:hypothetical protein
MAQRMSSLLPKPLGCRARNSNGKCRAAMRVMPDNQNHRSGQFVAAFTENLSFAIYRGKTIVISDLTAVA